MKVNGRTRWENEAGVVVVRLAGGAEIVIEEFNVLRGVLAVL